MESFNSRFIGESLEVLFEEKSSKDNIYEGYTSNYVRSKTYSDCDIIGKIKKLELVDIDGEILIGK